MSYDRANVPCGACHLCCKMMTPLEPDEWSKYQTAFDVTNRRVIVDRLPNGDCVYLGNDGCAIHDHAPRACQKFDCRWLFKHSDRAGRKLAVKQGRMPKAIFDRGRELLGMGIR